MSGLAISISGILRVAVEHWRVPEYTPTPTLCQNKFGNTLTYTGRHPDVLLKSNTHCENSARWGVGGSFHLIQKNLTPLLHLISYDIRFWELFKL